MFEENWTPATGAGSMQVINLTAAVVSSLTIPPGANSAIIQALEENAATNSDRIACYTLNGTNPETGVNSSFGIGANQVIYLTNLEQLNQFRAANAVSLEAQKLVVQYFKNGRY